MQERITMLTLKRRRAMFDQQLRQYQKAYAGLALYEEVAATAAEEEERMKKKGEYLLSLRKMLREICKNWMWIRTE